MSKPDAGDGAGVGRDLQDLLVRSLDTLRDSPREREKFPALDRMLSRIEARERGIVVDEAENPSAWRWLRPAFPSLTAAAAGFVGAALALAVLPGPVPPRAVEGVPAVTTLQSAGTSRDRLDRSIRRLEDAVHGLEKFQPLIESRIEWIEDEILREHNDAYVSVESKNKVDRDRSQETRSRRRSGV
jgi:hypothetical protein